MNQGLPVSKWDSNPQYNPLSILPVIFLAYIHKHGQFPKWNWLAPARTLSAPYRCSEGPSNVFNLPPDIVTGERKRGAVGAQRPLRISFRLLNRLK